MMLIIICSLKFKKEKLNITNACWKYGWKITGKNYWWNW